MGGTTGGDTDGKESHKEALGNQGKMSRRVKVGCKEARGDVKDGEGRHEKGKNKSRRKRRECEAACCYPN